MCQYFIYVQYFRPCCFLLDQAEVVRFRNTRARDDILSQYIQKQNAFDLASLDMSIFIQSTPAIADTPGGGGGRWIDLVSVMTRVRNSGVREKKKKTFCL